MYCDSAMELRRCVQTQGRIGLQGTTCFVCFSDSSVVGAHSRGLGFLGALRAHMSTRESNTKATGRWTRDWLGFYGGGQQGKSDLSC